MFVSSFMQCCTEIALIKQVSGLLAGVTLHFRNNCFTFPGNFIGLSQMTSNKTAPILYFSLVSAAAGKINI